MENEYRNDKNVRRNRNKKIVSSSSNNVLVLLILLFQAVGLILLIVTVWNNTNAVENYGQRLSSIEKKVLSINNGNAGIKNEQKQKALPTIGGQTTSSSPTQEEGKIAGSQQVQGNEGAKPQDQTQTSASEGTRQTEANTQVTTTKTYTVQNGDTLSSIASRFGVSIDELMAKNNLASTTIVQGQTLTVND